MDQIAAIVPLAALNVEHRHEFSQEELLCSMPAFALHVPAEGTAMACLKRTQYIQVMQATCLKGPTLRKLDSTKQGYGNTKPLLVLLLVDH